MCLTEIIHLKRKFTLQLCTSFEQTRTGALRTPSCSFMNETNGVRKENFNRIGKKWHKNHTKIGEEP